MLTTEDILIRWTFRQADLDRFAALSGDDNPIHTDPVYAATTRFGRTICHGMLLYSAIAALIGRSFPGLRQQQQELSFLSPVFTDEEITVRISQIGVISTENEIHLASTVIKADGVVACQANTLLKLI